MARVCEYMVNVCEHIMARMCEYKAYKCEYVAYKWEHMWSYFRFLRRHMYTRVPSRDGYKQREIV
jgi:hypothetical protein